MFSINYGKENKRFPDNALLSNRTKNEGILVPQELSQYREHMGKSFEELC
jgi:hypothetical protein